jgi:enoyl-CoA hydratase/carnithine racemase
MMAPPAHDDDEVHGYRGLIPVLEGFDKPLLAAVNGLALGIGTTILPYCDIVWIADDARLKVPFVTLGVTTEAAGSLLLPQRMGWQAASHFIFTADWMSAEEAVACGLAWKACPADKVLDEALAVARQIGGMPVDSLQTTKRLMLAARAEAVRAARQREDAEFVRMVGNQTNQAALTQFLT